MQAENRVQEIAKVLGLRVSRRSSKVWFSDKLSTGLPVTSLDRVCRLVAPDARSFASLIVSEGTLKRRRRQQAPLSPRESERLERVARVWTMAKDVFKSDDDARRFLHQPHGLLHGRKPIEIAVANDVGADAVEDILGRLKYGSAA